MEILGIGPLELLLILVIALIVMGPSDMVKAGRTIGKFLRQVVTSPTWRAVTQTSSELRRLPNRLIREAGLEEEIHTIGDLGKQSKDLGPDFERWQNQISPWTTAPDGEGVSQPGTQAPDGEGHPGEPEEAESQD
jgi:Sec-independent protein translocase protein TatA